MAKNKYAADLLKIDDTPDVPERVIDDSEESLFDMTETKSLVKIRKMSPLTRIAAYYYCKTQVPLPLLTKKLDQITVSEFQDICDVFGTLGKANWPGGVMGSLESLEYNEIRGFPIHVLKAGIVGAKIATVEPITDITLKYILLEIQGAHIKAGDNKGEAKIYVPGWDKEVIVSTVSQLPGKALRGAEEFLKWRHVTQDRAYEYKRVPLEAYKISRYLASWHALSVKDGKLIFLPRVPLVDRKAKFPFANPPLRLTRQVDIAKSIAIDAHDERRNVPTGISYNKSPIDILSWLFACVWDQLGKEDREVMVTIANSIDAYAASLIEEATPTMSKVTPVNFIRGKTGLFGVGIMTHGDCNKFVDAHRTSFRNTEAIDVARKSDAPPIARIGGANSCVPWKILHALQKTGVKNGTFPVDAYGTGQENHWSKVVADFSKGDPVWHDIKDEFRVENADFRGGAAGDIMKREKGSGKGRFLLDDTFVRDADSKARVIADYDYEGFVIKMYLGLGGDSEVIVGEGTGPGVGELLSKYDLQWSEGTGPHSPEYFLVGKRREGPEREEVLGDLLTAYVDQCVLLLKSNVYRSLQTRGGVLLPDVKWSGINEDTKVTLLPLGGKLGPRAPTVDLDKEKQKEKIPKRTSKYHGVLNGVNGEATNSDDVNPLSQGIERRIAAKLRSMENDILPMIYPQSMFTWSMWIMRPPLPTPGSRFIHMSTRSMLSGCALFASCARIDEGLLYVLTIPDAAPRLCILFPHEFSVDNAPKGREIIQAWLNSLPPLSPAYSDNVYQYPPANLPA